MDEYSGIWVFSEIQQLSFELLTKGRELADKTGTPLSIILPNITSNVDEYFRYGADVIFSITNPILETFQVDPYVDALASLANEKKPELIMIGATRNGLELAPRLAERLKAGYVTHAIELKPDADKEFVIIDRLSHEGSTLETLVSRIKPQIVTVARGTFTSTPSNSSQIGTIVNVSPVIKDSTTRILKIAKSDFDISNALVSVCVGRGVKRKEDIAMVSEFAKSIGADIAYTRSVGEEFGVASSDECLGFAGRRVNSKVCITCGISGQDSTIAGLANSRMILSINVDPSARIFKFSDYAVVGDLYTILPKLTAAINRLESPS